MTQGSIIGFQSIILILVCFISGLRLVFSPKVRNSTYKRYRITCYCLAGACACLAMGNIIPLAKNGLNYMTLESCSIISTTVSTSQSLLFTIALVTLFTDKKVNFSKLLLHVVPIVSFLLLYFIVTRFQNNYQAYSFSELIDNIPNNQPALVRLIYSFSYIIQCGFFTQFFLKVRKGYLSQAEQAVDVMTSEIRLEWIRVAFFAALAEGILAFCTIILFPGFESDFIFKIATTLFYIVFPIYYINYSKTYNKVKALLDESIDNRNTNTVLDASPIDSQENEEDGGMDALVLKLINRNNQLFQKAEIYMKKTLCYLDNEMKAEDLITALGTNRTYLANAIKQNKQTTISDYIMTYRLEHSKSVLKNRELKMEEVAFSSGFNSLRTFNRNFKNHLGMTPDEYRNTQLG